MVVGSSHFPVDYPIRWSLFFKLAPLYSRRPDNREICTNFLVTLRIKVFPSFLLIISFKWHLLLNNLRSRAWSKWIASTDVTSHKSELCRYICIYAAAGTSSKILFSLSLFQFKVVLTLFSQTINQKRFQKWNIFGGFWDFSKSLPDKPLKKSPWLLDMLKWARANRVMGCKLPQVRFVQIVRSGQIVRFIQTFLSLRTCYWLWANPLSTVLVNISVFPNWLSFEKVVVSNN